MPPTPAENEEIIGGGDNKQSSNNVANQCKIVSKFDHVGFVPRPGSSLNSSRTDA